MSSARTRISLFVCLSALYVPAVPAIAATFFTGCDGSEPGDGKDFVDGGGGTGNGSGLGDGDIAFMDGAGTGGTGGGGNCAANLTGRIRDFNDTHPDFEHKNTED